MKVLLLQDVYKLGRAGDIKKVADGYGRNYLIPQGLAALATQEAIKQAGHIRKSADVQRSILNKEMGGIAEQLKGRVLTFPVRASETGKLYGSVTTTMVAESLSEQVGIEISRRQIDSQPLRLLGEYTVGVRLTVDLIPEITVIVHREGEAAPTSAVIEVEEQLEVSDEQPEAGEEQVEGELPEEVEELEDEAEE